MSTDFPKEILNIKEAAELLGVSAKTFQKVLRAGDVPGRKVGREWKFSRSALIDWVGSGRSRSFLDSDDEPEDAGRAGAPGQFRPRVRRMPDNSFSAEED